MVVAVVGAGAAGAAVAMAGGGRGRGRSWSVIAVISKVYYACDTLCIRECNTQCIRKCNTPNVPQCGTQGAACTARRLPAAAIQPLLGVGADFHRPAVFRAVSSAVLFHPDNRNPDNRNPDNIGSDDRHSHPNNRHLHIGIYL